jgi:hypothetical protein
VLFADERLDGGGGAAGLLAAARGIGAVSGARSSGVGMEPSKPTRGG